MRMTWKIFLILICLIITGCTTENQKMISENTESESVQPTICTAEATTEISTEKPTEEKTEISTNPMTESTSTQEESTEAMLWYYMTTEEKWAYRFMRRYEDYGYQESLLYDIDYDGYIELLLRFECEWWGQYHYTILDIFEDSVNFNKTFETQTYYEPTYYGDTLCYFLMKGMPFSLYYDPVEKEYFYMGEVWFCGFKSTKEEIFVNRYDFHGEEVSVDTIAHYVYAKGDESEGENIYILDNEVFGNRVLETGSYPKNELYQLLGVEDYLAKYELISDSIFDDSNWKPLKEREKDLAECAKNYPVTVD